MVDGMRGMGAQICSGELELGRGSLKYMRGLEVAWMEGWGKNAI